jgi:hypothetical protein
MTLGPLIRIGTGLLESPGNVLGNSTWDILTDSLCETEVAD